LRSGNITEITTFLRGDGMSDTDKIIFKITQEQNRKTSDWIRQLNETIARKQLIKFSKLPQDEFKVKMIEKSIENGNPTPYYGAIGGAYVYKFCIIPTGLEYKVKNSLTKDEINLTDSDAIGDITIAQISGDEYQQILNCQQSIKQRLGDGVTFQYEFCYMSLGAITKVVCLDNNEELDVTDYDW
jgi:hypothetical protein